VVAVRRRRPALTLLALVLLGALLVPPAPAAAEEEEPELCRAEPHPRGEWPSYGHDVENSRSQPLETELSPATVGSLEEAWAFDAADTGGGVLNTTPVVAGGCLFVVPSSGVVHALDADTGALLWTTQLEASPPGYGGGVVGAPAVADDRLVAVVNRAGAPFLAALDVSTGAVLWETVIDETASAITNASVTVHEGMALVGFSGSPGGSPMERGGFVVVAVADGELLAKTWTIPDEAFDAGYGGASIWSTAAVDAETGHAYVGAGNPHSDRVEHERTNSLLKIDLDPSRPTFGEIVASYKGQPDSYVGGLDQQPACDEFGEDITYPYGSVPCLELDLDFGASPNLMRVGDDVLVGALQKSGVFHVAHTEDMSPAWETIIGVPCFACNASSAAFDGTRVLAAAGPPGHLVGLSAGSGALDWLAPVASGLHYFSVSHVNGVALSIDTYDNLLGVDTDTGREVLRLPMGASYGGPSGGSLGAAGSTGVAIARGTVYAATGGRVLAFRAAEDGDGGDGGGGGPAVPGLPDLPDAPVGPVVTAQPGSIFAGYTTPVSVTRVGGPLTFVNLDTALHDVVARDAYGPDDQPWCGGRPEGRCPLFWSRLVGLGATTPVLGLEHLEAGERYEFYCTIHPNMTGTLVALP
jgi:polyvinyl alcohol dehydrogenase (cytochrome)